MGLGEYDPYDPASVGTAARRSGGTTGSSINDYHNKTAVGAPGGGGGASRNHDELSTKAANLEEQMHSLRAIIDRAMDASGVGSAAGTGKLAFKALRQTTEGFENWWEAKLNSSLNSYHDADVYIKRAAAGLAGHRKWYAQANKRASKQITDALEDMRLASLVLQQKHGEEEDAAKAMAAASKELTVSVRAEHVAMAQLRAQLEPAVSAITDSVEELRAAIKSARISTATTITTAAAPTTPMNNNTVVHVTGGPDPAALMEEILRAREAADDAALALRRSQTAAQQDQAKMMEEIKQLRESLARDGAAAAVARAESEKWRAMYDAARNESGRDDKARSEVDALRLAVAHAEDRHRRELMLLGTEHGNAYAALRRSLAAAERRVADLEPALEASETRCRSREDQYREERNARLDLEETLARMRGDVERSAKEARYAKEEAAEAVEETEAKVARAEAWAKWRLAIAAAVRQNQDRKQSVGGNWRLAAAESKFNSAVEDLAKEQSRATQLERDLEYAKEELLLARAAAQAAERSDLPSVVAALEAEIDRRNDLARQASDSLAHEKEMRQAAEEETEATRAELTRLREQLDKALEKVKSTEEELTSAVRLKALAEAAAVTTGDVGGDAKNTTNQITQLTADLKQLTADLADEKRRRKAAEDRLAKSATSDAASSKSGGDSTPPVSPAYGKQMEALKKRIAQLEAELAAANERIPAPSSVAHTPPESTIGDGASSAEYYQYQYSSASDNLTVLSLLVQEVAHNQRWPIAGYRKVLHYGLPHGPMARYAGRLAVSLIPPRIVTMMWWEYLMFMCGAWFACIIGIAFFHGILLDDYPAVLLTPFIPSVIALVVRLCYTMPLNPMDGPRFVLNGAHIIGVPLAFTLLFLKMWNNMGNIDWWMVAVIPAGVLTRAIVDKLYEVVVEMSKTEYRQLGYGGEGTAFEYAFSEPEDDEVEIVREEKSSSKKKKESLGGGVAKRGDSTRQKNRLQLEAGLGGGGDESVRGDASIDNVQLSLDSKV